MTAPGTTLRFAAARGIVAALALTGDPLARFLRHAPVDDVYPLLERIRARGPLHRSRTGMIALTSHALCDQVLRDRRFGVRDAHDRPADHDPIGPELGGPLAGSFLDLDPPDHTRLRRLVAPAFRPAPVRALRTRIETATEDLLDRALAGAARGDGAFDLIADVAAPLPIRVITDLLGVPDVDTARFARYGAVVGRSISGVYSRRQAEELRAAGDDLAELFTRLERERRERPGDDVIGILAAARAEDRLTARELVATCGLLLVAGFETTVNLVGNATAALARHPAVWEALREDPRLASAVVSETLRWDPPVQATVRVAHEPVELAGRELPAGTRVMTLIAAANRDPAVYDDPARFDPTRTGMAEHLAFGSGIHYCLGAPLARLEGEIALQALARRLPSLRMAGPARRRPGNAIRGYATLPLAAPTARSVPTAVAGADGAVPS